MDENTNFSPLPVLNRVKGAAQVGCILHMCGEPGIGKKNLRNKWCHPLVWKLCSK
jgi:hypothetical protein